MIIHKPEFTHRNGEVELSARIEFNRDIPNVPERLWFRFPESCTDYLTARGDGLLLNMLIPAMHYGEDIEVRADVSPILLYNLKEYQYLYASRYHLSQVDIRCESVMAFEPEIPPEAVLLTYSGGVDSTYALWSHLPQNQPITSMRVTHGLLLQGYNAFDIPLEDPVYFNFVYDKFARLFNSLGLSLLYAKTNIYQFAQFRIDWFIAHGSALSGIVHHLAGFVKTHIKADGGGYHHRNKFYLDSESTHLLSSETLEVVFFSRLYGREDKLKVLAQWEPARTHLRVCLNWHKEPDQLNCSHCQKCLYNMIMLDLVGEYEKFTVFKQPFSHLAILRWGLEVKASPIAMITLIELARNNRRYGVLLILQLIAISKTVVGWIFKKLDSCLTDEVKYKIRAHVYNVPHVTNSLGEKEEEL